MSSIIGTLFGVLIVTIGSIIGILSMDDDSFDAFRAMLWCISERIHGRKF